MKFSIQLLDSDKEIQKQIIAAISGEIQKTIIKAIPNIKAKIQDAVKNAVKSEPEYKSLVSGELKYEFGITDSISKVENIINTMTSNINIRYSNITTNSRGLKGGFSLEMIPSDFADILGLGDSYVQDQKGYSLPWLQWLLLEGGNILVRNYQVVIGPSPYSRTGNAVMKPEPGTNWVVPPKFAGTINNNWITRSISRIDNQINNIIEEEVIKAIS